MRIKTKRARVRENIAKTVKEKHIQVSAGTPVDIRKAGNLDMY